MTQKNYQFISFKIGGQIFAMPLNKDSQFFTCEHILALPLNNKYLAGLSYLNGQLVTILRTDKILDLSTWKPSSSWQCLLFSYRGDFYGLAVDQGLEVVSAKQIFQEKNKKIFNQYIKVAKDKLFVIEAEEIFSLIKIYA